LSNLLCTDTHRLHQTYKCNGALVMENVKKNILTPEQEKEFIKAYKIGILKQLHKKKLITDMQLNQLISMQK